MEYSALMPYFYPFWAIFLPIFLVFFIKILIWIKQPQNFAKLMAPQPNFTSLLNHKKKEMSIL